MSGRYIKQIDHPLCKRLKDLKHQQCEKSPCDRASQTDPAMQVKRPFAVIPPACVEELFHYPRSNILQDGCQNDAAKKQP